MRASQKVWCFILFGFFLTTLALFGEKIEIGLKTTKSVNDGDAVTAAEDLSAEPVAATAPAVLDSGGFDTFHSESLFDSLGNSLTPVTTTVEVFGGDTDLETSGPAPIMVGAEDVLTSAGTYGDISRYMQLLPGVVATSDFSNQMLVRGGHPMENLFLLDGIEVPNINHMANANSTGGFGPMIDAAAIQGLKLYTGGFEARYPERLSSVTAIRTLDPLRIAQHLEADLGIQGVGGLAEMRVHGGDLLASAHHGLLNVVSSNAGINGVPAYTNELTRYRRSNTAGDHLLLLNVAGVDSIEISPCASDTAETSTINSQYMGWRETTGGEWQHVYTSHSFGVFGISDSEQIEHINQQDQIADPTKAGHSRQACPIPANLVQSIPVYKEDSNDAFSTASYRHEWATSQLALTAGSSAWIQRPHFQVSQPVGMFSPYSNTPTRTDLAAFRSNFSTGETGTYAQLMLHPLKPLSMSLGGRFQTFAFGNHTSITPRVSMRYRLGEFAGIHVAYAGYAQMPPYVYMLAYPENRSMLPMRVTHEIIGLDFSLLRSSQIRVEAYRKEYTDIPASTEYPAVTLHTMVDMLGEQSVWLPMNSRARGSSSGIELSDTSRFGSRLQMQSSVTYSRAKFAGLSGNLRPSNFDFPWILNAAGVERLGHGFILSGRYGFATGRPYTPFDFKASLAQNRPIYDLTQVNKPRAPYYGRLDAQVNKEISILSVHLELYGGVDNLLNRSNFLSYAWMPRYGIGSSCRNPVGTLWQMPIFPNFGVRVIVR